MIALFLIATTLQGVAILVDEFYFHWKRGLPRWERLGHPVDTLSLAVPIGIAAFTAKVPATEIAFISFSVLSCLLITKDEWIHREHSSASENWLHAVLFVLHPITLTSAYFCWTMELSFLKVFFFVVSVFMVYQLLFWTVYADRILKSRS